MGHCPSLLLLGAEQRREKRKGGARATMPAKPKRVVLGLAFSLQCTLACRFRRPRTCTPRSCFLSADSQNTLQSWSLTSLRSLGQWALALASQQVEVQGRSSTELMGTHPMLGTTTPRLLPPPSCS
ncbi:hypothetical protein ZEAMMB73_Zm00001d001904 [Zea mays]|uniref:Uncharacterized protein n=1 Tax=Zea mays TaxID=4577 RepID=A0A1D6DU58_MAIZE|nr:hypothetical protein ZEAMMB73_Zm00001d001904 [Zea mays]